MKDFEYNIEDRIVNCYKKIINEGVNLSKKKFISNFIVFFIAIIFLLFSCCLLNSKFLFLWVFIVVFLLGMIVLVILLQNLDNKKFLYYGIELEKPLWRSFQNKAFKKYNNIVCSKLYAELVFERLLLNDKEDLKILDGYILRFEKNKKKNYRKSILVGAHVSFLVLIISQGIHFSSLLFDKNKDSIYDLFLHSFLVSFLLATIYFGIYTISCFVEYVVNRRFNTQDRICDFLEVIKMNCILSKNIDVVQEKE